MSVLSRNSKYDHVFAIVRVDSFHHHDATPEDTITVKKIVPSQHLAEDEVARLNSLNREKGVLYFWKTTRLERSGDLPEADASASERPRDVAATGSGS